MTHITPKRQVVRPTTPRPRLRSGVDRRIVGGGFARAIACVAACLTLVAGAACKDVGGVVVQSLSFEGVHVVNESELKLALATNGSSRLPWAPKTYFNRSEFDQDLRRVEQYYASKGYPDARVKSYRAHYNQDKTAISLTVVVEEGAPLMLEAVEYVGFDALPSDHLDSLRNRAGLKGGVPRDQQQVQIAHSMALDELRDHGYPQATIAVSERPGNPHAVVVTLTATPGTYATFGEIKVTGNRSVNREVIDRQLAIHTGRPYRLSAVQASQRRLYGLELFQFVNVEISDVDAAGQVTTTISVVEAPHRQFTLGVGYGSEDHARVDAKFQHVNFLGGARVGSVEGKFSTLERGVRLSFTEPALGHALSLGMNGQSWYANTPAYTLRTTGGRLSLLRSFGRGEASTGGRTRDSVSVALSRDYESYRVSQSALDDASFRPTLIALGLNPETGEGQGAVAAVVADLQHNTVSNLLDAHSGLLASVHGEFAGRLLGGDFAYREISAEARSFVPIGASFVVATRLRAGVIGGPGDEETTIPFFKRYFLGGATSLRGWGRFEVAPLTANGLPIGGFSMVESSGEVRWMPGTFGAVAFVDAGNVWGKQVSSTLRDLKIDVGSGLRYRTPVGPLRLDIAYQLTPIDELVIKGGAAGVYRRFRFHFSIGQAF